jgi:phosphatidylglycerol:prolipoprotein diacylglycerol transferase
MFPYFTLFGRELGLYSLMILCGVFSSGIYACLTAKKFEYDYSDIIIFLLTVSIGVIAGSRLLYAVVNYKNIIYVLDNIKNIDTPQKLTNVLNYIFGGSIFYGGLFGGIITGYIISQKNNKYLSFFDIGAASIPLFHFFGRVGCFLGGCCYGIENLIGFIYTKNPIAEANNIKRFPVQLLEALFNIVLFIILNNLLKKGKYKNKIIYVYFAEYSVGRFFLEFLRGDTYRGIWFALSTSQIISIIVVLFLIMILINKNIKRTPKHPCLGAS